MTARKKRASVVAIKTATSRPVLLLWISVSLTVAVLCTWSYSQPAWTLRSSSEIGSLSASSGELIIVEDISSNDSNSSSSVPGKSAIPLVHIGLFGLCIYAPQSSVICVTHAELDYDWLPPAWQVTQVLCGGGCLILLLSAGASVLVGLLIRQHHRQQRAIKIAALAQLSAALLMLLGLCFYPFGLRAETLSHFCDGRCQPGWSSLIAGLSSAAAFLCPILASLVSNPIYDVNPWEAYLLL